MYNKQSTPCPEDDKKDNIIIFQSLRKTRCMILIVFGFASSKFEFFLKKYNLLNANNEECS